MLFNLEGIGIQLYKGVDFKNLLKAFGSDVVFELISTSEKI